MRNECRSIKRLENRLRKHSDEIQMFLEVERDYLVETPSQAVDNYEILLGSVRPCLDNLPARCQQVVHLKLGDRSNREIADRLGISIKTVEHHYTTAIRLLRTMVAREAE